MKIAINLEDKETLKEIMRANDEDDKGFFEALGQIVCAQTKLYFDRNPDMVLIDLLMEE